jgi:micrococcal nuclease
MGGAARLWCSIRKGFPMRALVLLLIAALSACASTPATKAEPAAQAPSAAPTADLEPMGAGGKSAPSEGKVVDILKGDEIVLDNGWVVRLIGIDVPTADYGKREGNFYGKAAIDLARARALGASVKLEYDKMRTDRYDRALAYIRLPDGTLLNEVLVREGLAVVACFPPNTERCPEFAASQAAALANRKGLWDFNPADWPQAGRSDNMVEGVRVRSVLDGDTVQLEDGTVVRMIGIDAPESEEVWKEGAFGYEAFETNRRLLEGKLVDIEYDVEFSDPRGRELAWLWVGTGEDKKLVNAEIVRSGHAWVAVFPPNIRHIRTLFEAQQAAFESGAGIWKR